MKKMISSALAVILAVLSITSFVGCQTQSDKTVYKIGICQLVQHDALDRATEGFKAAVIEKLGADNVKFDYQNAGGEGSNCTIIAGQFVASNVDLIMANATAALQASANATTTIPIVATSITDYATALGMTEWSGKTGRNITGTSDLAPLAEQAQMLKELFPDAKKVGILYCSAEPNSKYQADEITKSFVSMGLEVKSYTFADTNDITAIANNACAESDVLYIPTDNTAATCAGTIEPIASAANVPVIAGEAALCKGCGVATLSIDYYTIGYKAGEMAVDILKNGKNPADMEIQLSSELTKQYIPERLEKFNVTAPEGYEKIELS